jgi:cytochrome P450 PksS
VAFWLPAIWIVTRYDDVVSILKDPRFSKDYIRAYPWIPHSMRAMFRHLLSIDPPDHTRLRSLVQKAFTPRLIEGLRGRIQGICDDLLDRAGNDETIELIEAYALPVPLTIISDLLGVPLEDRRRFGPWTKKVAAASASASVVDFMRALPSLTRLSRYIRELVTQRRASPQDDLITALVRAEESGDRLTEDEIVSMVVLLLLAGHETTVHLIASGALTLMQYPGQGVRMQETPKLRAWPASGRTAGLASLAQEPCAARAREIAGENARSRPLSRSESAGVSRRAGSTHHPPRCPSKAGL